MPSARAVSMMMGVVCDRTDFTTEAEPVEEGHHDVKQDDIRDFSPVCRAPSEPVRRRPHGEAVSLQQPHRGGFADDVVVLDEQDAGRGLVRMARAHRARGRSYDHAVLGFVEGVKPTPPPAR